MFSVNGLKPNHIFFDNNCSLAKMVKQDEFFDDIGLMVDVFHFTSKHTTSNTFCQENCNPQAYPELIGEDGQGWFFNLSIAEQINVWLGGYHSVDKYNFFLDEMIMRKNRMTKMKLNKSGSVPSSYPLM